MWSWLPACLLTGVATLSGLLADAHARYVLFANGLGWIGGLMPALQLYAAAFFTIPALRWILNSQVSMAHGSPPASNLHTA